MRRHLLTPTQAAERLGISVTELTALRRLGTGPDHLAIGAKVIRYLPEDLDQWTTNNHQ